MTTWFTADQHFGHINIMLYCNRQFDSVEAMDAELINRWNMFVMPDDTVYHLGDFTLFGYDKFNDYVGRLNGTINFIPGSHDWRWMNRYIKMSVGLHNVRILDSLYTIEQGGIHNPDNWIIVLCHYAMRVWDRSHYNSWQLYGHSHGMLEPVGKQMDVGVDNINKLYGSYRPVSFEEVRKYMLDRPDNPNLVKEQ